MPPDWLIVSDPPHGRADVVAAAPHLDLAPPDLALKVNYPIPEIWAALPGEDAAQALASTLRHAGLRVVLVPAAALADLPLRRPVQSAALSTEGIILLAEGRRVELPWTAAALGVYYTPRAPASARPTDSSGPPGRGAACDGPFLELYVLREHRPERYAVLPDLSRLSGLGDLGPLSPAGKLARLVQLCAERLPAGRLDRRLVNMQVRHWPPPGRLTASQLVRKGFFLREPGAQSVAGPTGSGTGPAQPLRVRLSPGLPHLAVRAGKLSLPARPSRPGRAWP